MYLLCGCVMLFWAENQASATLPKKTSAGVLDENIFCAGCLAYEVFIFYIIIIVPL